MALLRAKGTASPGLGSARNHALPGIYYFCFHTHPRIAPRPESRLPGSRGLGVGAPGWGVPPGRDSPVKVTRLLSQPPSFTPGGGAGGRPKAPPAPASPSAAAGDPPCGGALPHVAHHALEGLGAVAEGADAAVPVALVRGGFRLPLRPAETHARQEQHRARHPHAAASPPGAPRRRPPAAIAAGSAHPAAAERARGTEEGAAAAPTWSGSSCLPCRLQTRPRPGPGAALCVFVNKEEHGGGSLSRL